jgi:hypothetical protein
MHLAAVMPETPAREQNVEARACAREQTLATPSWLDSPIGPPPRRRGRPRGMCAAARTLEKAS